MIAHSAGVQMSGFGTKSVNLRMSYRVRGITLVVTDPLCGAGDEWRATVIVSAVAPAIADCTDRARRHRLRGSP